jgi:probable rRNA maturation factor
MAPPSQSKVSFHFEVPGSILTNRRSLKKFLPRLFDKEGQKLSSLTYIFTSDNRLLGINKQYLKHDFYTDIISFDLSDPGQGITGEIYISLDRVRDNAKNLGFSMADELHRVIFHGALHLCGYKDKTRKEISLMRAMENKYLDLYKRFM